MHNNCETIVSHQWRLSSHNLSVGCHPSVDWLPNDAFHTIKCWIHSFSLQTVFCVLSGFLKQYSGWVSQAVFRVGFSNDILSWFLQCCPFISTLFKLSCISLSLQRKRPSVNDEIAKHPMKASCVVQ